MPPAWPDSAAFWRDKHVIVTGDSKDPLEPIACPPGLDGRILRKLTLLVNELLLMCDKLGLDAWEVLEAAATKPFGFMKFTPGPGLGGHCIPIDPLYLY